MFPLPFFSNSLACLAEIWRVGQLSTSPRPGKARDLRAVPGGLHLLAALKGAPSAAFPTAPSNHC